MLHGDMLSAEFITTLGSRPHQQGHRRRLAVGGRAVARCCEDLGNSRRIVVATSNRVFQVSDLAGSKRREFVDLAKRGNA